MATTKYVMLVDTDRCVNCKACITACKAEWNTPPGVSRNRVTEVVGTGDDGIPFVSFVSGRCQHCDHPPCVDACPVGATYKRDDGMVLIDRDICTGCEFCVDACPYDARYRDPVDGMISKCTFCQPRVDAGRQPACVEVCFTHALTFGNANDPASRVSRMLATGDWKQLVTADIDTGPSLYYSNATVFDATVLPHPVQLTAAARVLDDVVNPGIQLGVGGMLGLFGAAGMVKLVRRRREVSEHE